VYTENFVHWRSLAADAGIERAERQHDALLEKIEGSEGDEGDGSHDK
jgi:hypothetical protein